ncbi:MAG: DUF1415 family protein [Myxococcales bacterium]|nr:DUF1415 family protein [Myxococcales bacterium]
MDGARRHDDHAPPGAPPPEVVHRVHDRYLLEVVEALGLCPFARRSRELGRVHRPLVYDAAPSPHAVAARIRRLVLDHPDAEIVLVTFVAPTPKPQWDRARHFDDFVKDVRERYIEQGEPMFFMVGFHPRSGALELGEAPPRLTPDSLVPQLRRTPDPVIQCIRAEELERARAQAQQAHRARLIAREKDPMIRAMLADTIMTDSSLSADIARHNFEAVAQGQGREVLEARLDDIQRDHDRAYAPYWAAGSDQ